jgi:peroxiredoxin Q/BCP
MLEVGATVAPFTLRDQAGQEVSWASFRGRPVVFFFYPKANTPGCTQEACAFRDLHPEFMARGVAVVGVSADSPKAQAGFAHKYDLTMPLLSDPEHQILKPWGVWGQKKLYGKDYEGIVRSTFLFDADGTVRHVWPKVSVKGHAEAVLKRIDAWIPK